MSDVDIFKDSMTITQSLTKVFGPIGGILFELVSFICVRKILRKCIRKLSKDKTAIQTSDAWTGPKSITQMSKAKIVVLAVAVILVVGAFSLFRTVTVDDERVRSELHNKYSEYSLCEVGSDQQLMFTWSYYSLKKKVREDMQALMEEVKVDKEWVFDYELNDQDVSIYVDSAVDTGAEARLMLKKGDPYASSFPAYYVLLGDYGDRILDYFVMLETLEGKAENIDRDGLMYQDIKFYDRNGTEVEYQDGW